MRSRLLRPDFFSDDKIAECGPMGLHLYLGLMCLADRDGRLEDRPMKIKVQVIPYFDCNVDEVLDLLAKAKLIIRYQVADLKLIEIADFDKYQQVYAKEKSEGFPSPSECNTSLTKATTKLSDSFEEASEQLLNRNRNRNRNNTKGECEGEIEKPKTVSPLPVDLAREIPKELEAVRREIESWILYKRERGKGYKPSGLAALLNKLKTFPPNVVASAIQTSMANNWDGLFPEKAQGSQGYRPINAAQAQQDMLDRIIAEEEAKLHG
jgi:hypothetical protein